MSFPGRFFRENPDSGLHPVGGAYSLFFIFYKGFPMEYYVRLALTKFFPPRSCFLFLPRISGGFSFFFNMLWELPFGLHFCPSNFDQLPSIVLPPSPGLLKQAASPRDPTQSFSSSLSPF